jgi:hypothetical protein
MSRKITPKGLVQNIGTTSILAKIDVEPVKITTRE